jgi:hypothetical protein
MLPQMLTLLGVVAVVIVGHILYLAISLYLVARSIDRSSPD